MSEVRNGTPRLCFMSADAKSEAEALAIKVQVYWRERGYDFRFILEQKKIVERKRKRPFGAFNPVGVASIWAIVSNCRNGFPPRMK